MSADEGLAKVEEAQEQLRAILFPDEQGGGSATISATRSVFSCSRCTGCSAKHSSGFGLRSPRARAACAGVESSSERAATA
jgi:hypothetical protein